MTEPRGTPAFTGLLVHRDRQFNYSVLIPDGWQRMEQAQGGGVFYAPDVEDPLTGLAIDARDLGTTIKAADLPALRRGFLAGLRRLPGCKIHRREAEAVGQLISLEARHTYLDGETIRPRWVRLLYQGRTELRLIAQAATQARFAYWEPMFYEAMRTIHFGDWAADPSVD